MSTPARTASHRRMLATCFIGALRELDCYRLAARSYYAEFAPMGFTELGGEHGVTQIIFVSNDLVGITALAVGACEIAISQRRICRPCIPLTLLGQPKENSACGASDIGRILTVRLCRIGNLADSRRSIRTCEKAQRGFSYLTVFTSGT